MKAHEFANALLQGPDIEITLAGCGPHFPPPVTQKTLKLPNEETLDVLVVGLIDQRSDGDS